MKGVLREFWGGFGGLWRGLCASVGGWILTAPPPPPFSPLQAGAEISTVHPEQYAKRFLDFITNIFA